MIVNCLKLSTYAASTSALHCFEVSRKEGHFAADPLLPAALLKACIPSRRDGWYLVGKQLEGLMESVVPIFLQTCAIVAPPTISTSAAAPRAD